MDTRIKPVGRLRGEIELPGDKSISHRVALIGSISKGRTRGKNFLRAEDCLRTVSAFRGMAVDIKLEDNAIAISGAGLKGLRKPEKDLYLGNSGTTMRILPGILAGQDFSVTLTGDESLTGRPMKRIIEPLCRMGVDIKSRNMGGFPPLEIKGGEVRPLAYQTEVASAQVKSCVLFAGLYAKGVTSVTEPYLSRDHTERMLGFCGANIKKSGLTVSVEGMARLNGADFFIPGDISSAAFFIAGALLVEGSEITVRDVGLNPTRMGFLEALSRMGADLETVTKSKKTSVEPYGDIRVKFSPLKAVNVSKEEIPLLIDEIPALAVVASRASGTTRIEGAGELRVKETDRLKSITESLRKLGSDASIEGEDLIIKGSDKRFEGATIESHGDHRTAMSMAIAALAADGECEIKNTECVNTSFPQFFDILKHISS